MTDGENEMVTIPKPRPGTVASNQPVPALVEQAVRLIDEGSAAIAAAERLAAGTPAGELQAAHLWWVRRMPKESWNDHEASAVLRALEHAVALTNSKVRGPEGRSGVGRPRASRKR